MPSTSLVFDSGFATFRVPRLHAIYPRHWCVAILAGLSPNLVAEKLIHSADRVSRIKRWVILYIINQRPCILQVCGERLEEPDAFGG